MKTKLTLFIAVIIIGLISSTQAAEPKPLIDKALLKKSLLINSDFEKGLEGWQMWAYEGGHPRFGGANKWVEGGNIKVTPNKSDILGGGKSCLIPKSLGYLGVASKKTIQLKKGEIYHLVVTLKGEYASLENDLNIPHHFHLTFVGEGATQVVGNRYAVREYSIKSDEGWTRVDKIIIVDKDFTGRPLVNCFRGNLTIDNFVLVKRN
jgi:hypothetical protein